MGLKRHQIGRFDTPADRFRRTLVGLKLVCNICRGHRTPVFQTDPCGVEARSDWQRVVTELSFRRTLVGLKLKFGLRLRLVAEFQTDPCGVEASM